MNPKPFPEKPLRGYAEGYYGQLLSWQERSQILQTLETLNMNVWFYAPKEDPCHRLHWRRRWDESWMRSFSLFCSECRSSGVHVIAGLAPGLDFDFAALSEPEAGGAGSSQTFVMNANCSNGATADDYSILLQKARSLLDAGADYIGLLMDDIDPDFTTRAGSFQSEGCAHATLANRLGDDLGICMLVVPRIYANELVIEDPDYLPGFANVLDSRHLISHCGENVVSRVVTLEQCGAHLGTHPGTRDHRIVVWDNLYANDYCPRRLFVCEWTGREAVVDVVLNPTGLPFTDQLLLEMMACWSGTLAEESGQELSETSTVQDLDGGHYDGPAETRKEARRSTTWRSLMDRHGVPAEFDHVAKYCWHPFCNGDTWDPITSDDIPVEAIERALDEMLWRWKTPLALEWYPYLMGLRQDLVCRSGKLPDLRIMKTQTRAMASELLDPSP